MQDFEGKQRLVDAPPGALCAVHVDAPATVVCARCGNYCCYECGVMFGDRYLCTSCFELARQSAHYGSASKGQRFANFVIDQLAARFMTVLAAIELNLLQGRGWLIYVASPLITVAYYVAFESNGGRTLGKMVTRTKVVADGGGAPRFGQIVGRSICRYIPFEPFSLLIEEQGWHDGLSGTRVVRTTPPDWLKQA